VKCPPAARIFAALPLLAAVLLAAGCAHSTLRRAFDIPRDVAIDADTVKAAVERKFPPGTPMDEVKRALPPSNLPVLGIFWGIADAWRWAEGDPRAAANAPTRFAEYPRGEGITIESHTQLLSGGMERYIEIILRFKDRMLTSVAVRDRGRPL
jgi:hypothetical protein